MISEQGFEKLLKSWCCVNCIHFKDECTEEGAAEHNKDKEELRQAYHSEYLKGIVDPNISNARREMLMSWKHASENINEMYLCTEFKRK